MSENPIPTQTATTTAPTKVTGLERTGTGLTVLGVVAAAIPLLYLAFASNITLSTSDAVQNVLTGGLILAIAGAVVGLVATGLNLPGLTKRLGPGLSTVFSGATLITMALFLFVTVLPRVSAVSNLNNNIEPFAKSLNANCKVPLKNVQNDFQKVQEDANGLAALIAGAQQGGPAPTANDVGAFIQSMTADQQIFQTDASNFGTYQANLGKLTSPDAKYDALLAGCKKDVAGELDVLGGNPGGIPTADYVKTVDGLLAAQTKDPAAQQLEAQIVQGNFPQAYNAQTLLQASVQIVQGKETVTLPPGLTPAQQKTLSVALATIFAATFPGYVSQAMGTLSTTSDPALTSEGNQLEQDIRDTLTKNLAPFNVDTDAIINAASK